MTIALIAASVDADVLMALARDGCATRVEHRDAVCLCAESACRRKRLITRLTRI
jgi:hypothetical protein